MNKNDEIIRPEYLDNIKPFVDLKMIKIFAGVLRSGKSYLLDMVGDELLSRGVKRNHIIYKLYTSIDSKKRRRNTNSSYCETTFKFR